MNKRYTIKEYDSFTRNVDVQIKRFSALSEHTFDQLEQFILANKKHKDTDALELMTISSKRGIGKIISAKNYVGLITMNDGTEIEILPKLYFADEESSEEETKRVFLDMLKSLKEIPYKTFNGSHLHIEKNSIFEIFIRMFIEETYTLVKLGLKSSYIEYQGNEHYYKGKLNISQHIKANFAHKERFYIEYDIFSVNRVENKLVKATLEFLKKVTSNVKSKKDIRTLLTAFEKVSCSENYEQDFAKIVSDRNIKEYETVLKWCRIFLMNKSFTAFAGNEFAYALLFPMEKVFESYIAKEFKKVLDNTYYQIKTQDRVYNLFDYPKRFLLKPDIVVRSKHSSIIMDTKWKLLSSNQSNYGISQGDMYQMYAYGKKYDSKMVFLLYPYTNSVKDLCEPISYKSIDNVTVRIYFVDLMDITNSIKNITQQIDELLRE